jgi:proteasome beta subunit
VCKECIILAADKRATAGNLIVDKKVQKVVPINEYIAVTTAGSVSDLQLLMKYLKAELKLKDIRTTRRATVKEAANLLSGMVYTNLRTVGGISHFLLAGHDNGTAHLYDIFPDGSITKVSDFVSSGSGSVFAYGVLESTYKENMSEQEGTDLVFKAINASLQRDAMSGQGIDIFVIDKNGIREVLSKLLDTRLVR